MSSLMHSVTASRVSTSASVSTHQRLVKMRNFFFSSIWAAKKQITPMTSWQISRPAKLLLPSIT